MGDTALTAGIGAPGAVTVEERRVAASRRPKARPAPPSGARARAPSCARSPRPRGEAVGGLRGSASVQAHSGDLGVAPRLTPVPAPAMAADATWWVRASPAHRAW